MKAHHLTDMELREALTKSAELLPKNRQLHLQQCSECLLALHLMQSFPVGGRLPLTSAPATLIARAQGIPEEKASRSIIERLVTAATLLFDSWASPLPAGVRSEQRNTRRLRYSASGCELDLQFTHGVQGWQGTARAVATVDTTALAIRIGRRTYLPDSAGFVTWQTVRPPRGLSVVAGSSVVLQASLNWKGALHQSS